MEQPYMYVLHIPYSQYYAWLCSGDFGNQGINRHGIIPKAGIFRFKRQKG